jgi:ABC-type transport system substrate-binding protein
VPGFKDERIYPFTPDLAAARRRTGDRRRTAILYTCNTSPCDRLAQIVKTNLGAIGIDVATRAFPFLELFRRVELSGEPFDLAFPYGWFADYPDPANFLVSGAGPGLSLPFDDPAYQRKARAASRLSGPDRYRAYGTLDADTARHAAPWAAVGKPLSRDFFSARIGCQVYQPVYGMNLAGLCIRR